MASLNPNISASCTEVDWDEEEGAGYGDLPLLKDLPAASGPEVVSGGPVPAEIPSEWHHFDEMDEPSVIECLEAEIAAKKIIAEMAAQEAKALEQKLSNLRQHVPKT
jgi:hypothetical protein